MKIKRNNYATASLGVLVLTLIGYSATMAQEEASSSVITGPNYLYIQEYEISPGTVPKDAIAVAQELVKGFRATDEYKSVRLFIHNTGPLFAIYILMEPNSWQAIEDGANKFFAANPGFFDNAFNWGKHSDNLLNEVPVE